MHELAIARSLLDIVRDQVPAGQASRVRRVSVQVGPLAGVVPDSLIFCFEAIIRETPFEPARLEVEQVPIRARCRGCSHAFESPEPAFTCPACGRGGVEVLSGAELQLCEIELADDPEEAG
jgi:hydrogenase nickel incorporation protein HypA/HybF